MKFYIYFTLALIVILIAWFFWWTSSLEPQVTPENEAKSKPLHIQAPSLAATKNL